MANLDLTWSAANNCWVKVLGAWYDERGRRIPRFFRFKHSNTLDGLRAAQDELMPWVVEWRRIRHAAKVAGNKKPVWHRKALVTIPAPTTFDLARPSDPEEDADTSQIEQIEKLRARREELLRVAEALRANDAANPDKPLSNLSVKEAREVYGTFCKSSGNKSRSIEGHLQWLDCALAPAAKEMGMANLTDIEGLVQFQLDRVAGKEIAARTAFNYCKALKSFFEWYARKSKSYDLPENFRELFLKRRFKKVNDGDKIFTKDGEEQDFEIYTPSDLKVLFECCNTNRQRLYLLLGLQAGMYYEDIAKALLTRNVHLEEERPFLIYQRTKEEHHDPITQVVWLWDETARLLRKEMNAKQRHPFALLSEDQSPMTRHGPAQTWDRVQARALKRLPHRRSVRFKDLRKTGGSAVANHSSIDLGELHLGHKIPSMGRAYIKLAKDRLYEPLMKWRAELDAAGVFDSFVKRKTMSGSVSSAA